VISLFKVLTKKFVKESASQFSCEFPHTLHALFSTEAITCFAQDGFNNNEELMEGVKTWLSSMAVDFFDTGIQELIL
jgi:hypothetical protein